MKILHFFCRLALFVVLLLSGTFANAKYPVKKLSTIFVDHAVQGINPAIASANNVLQLFTHGRPGELFINNEWKSKEAIAVWLKENYALANYKHINIYGCEFAKGEKGLAAVKYLEQHLAVAIAASTNITGKDGDWKMEIGKEINLISLPGYQYNLQVGCPVNPTVIVVPNTDCFNHNGSITVTNVLTPAADHEYSKDLGFTWQSSNVFNNLSRGAYSILYRNINQSVTCRPRNGFAYVSTTISSTACEDTDEDGILNQTDIDDDNDGILDKVECPMLFTNLAANGGFSPAATAITNWYVGIGESAFPGESPFTPTVNPLSKFKDAYTELPTHSGNSTITGGLFDMVDGVNTTGGLEVVLQEGDPQAPIVCQLSMPLVAGQEYLAAFDLGGRINTSFASANYVVLLYNANTRTPEQIIATDLISTLPEPTDLPAYKTISASFKPNSSANYYLLFYSSDGGPLTHYTIDRVAVAGNSSGLCDTDTDALPNHLELESDNDGCTDAFETGITGTLINGLIHSGDAYLRKDAVAQGGYGANGFADALEMPIESGIYTGSYTNYSKAIDKVGPDGCNTRTPNLVPDVNSTYVGMEVTGNVSRNDWFRSWANYSHSSITTLPGYTNPAGDMAVLTGTDGAYTFTATTTPGIYKFLVHFCSSEPTINCETEELVITVLDRNVQTNLPSVSGDFGMIRMNMTLTMATLANDRSGNSMTTLNPATVSIIASPKRGTASVNTTNGDITYTPAQGFLGFDTLTYTVCDNATPTINCATARQIITVLLVQGIYNLQPTDDYTTTLFNTPTTGSIFLNDTDPDGDRSYIGYSFSSRTTTTVPGKGTLEMKGDGTYTFTPEAGFFGPVSFEHISCDAREFERCQMTLLHILVAPPMSTLPVKLIGFQGYNKREGNMLEWKTSSEVNSSHFDILYSNSGQNFVKIGTVSTAGNSSTELAYNFLHAQAQAGNNFYQLVSVDVDGKKEYSSIINIRMNANSKLTVSPVPAKNEVTIKAPKEELLMLKLYSITGQDVTAMVRIVKLGETVSMMYINQLPSGIYYLKTKTQSTKIIKQ